MFGPKKEITWFSEGKTSPDRIFRFRMDLQEMGIKDDSLKLLTDEEIMDLLNGLKALCDLDER